MSKAQLKKFLKDLERGQLEEFILDLYSDVKPAKEYLDFFLNPAWINSWKPHNGHFTQSSIAQTETPCCV